MFPGLLSGLGKSGAGATGAGASTGTSEMAIGDASDATAATTSTPSASSTLATPSSSVPGGFMGMQGLAPGPQAAQWLGTGISMFSDIMGGITANKIQSRISGQYLQQAEATKLATGAQVNAEDYQANQLLARSRTGAAASGVTQGGSARLVNNSSYTEQNLKDAYTRYSGALQSNADIYAAANARWQGSVAETTGFVNAGTSLLTQSLTAGN